MPLDILAQAAALGLLQGGVYALIAAGLTLIYGVIKIVNFAHAEFVAFGMYLAVFTFTVLGIGPYPGLILILPAAFLLGVIVERLCIRPALSHPQINQMLITIGISTVMIGAIQMLWGADNQVVRLSYAREAISVGDVRLTLTKLIAFTVSLGVAIGFWLFLKTSRLGMAMRATAQNPDAARLMGINTQIINTITFGMGFGLAALAGALVSPTLSIYPSIGVDVYLLPAFVIVVLGTMGNFLGALIGGLIIGLAEGLGGFFLGSSLKLLIALTIFVAILLLAPRGLFGRRDV